MVGTILDMVKMARDAWPRRWSNVKSRLHVPEMGLDFACEGKGKGILRVTLLDASGQMVANLEGENRHDGDVRVGYNADVWPDALLTECFRMARCYREFERTGDLDLSRHYQYFRTRAVYRWELLREAREAELAESD